MNASKIEIQPFSAQYGEGVVALILAIQQAEFGTPVSLADQPDLLDVPNFYQNGQGNFWVALDEGEVVGSIALLGIGDGRAALRKMFVSRRFRGVGSGLAQRLLQTLLQWSREHGVQEIYLGTTEQFLAAHRFYEKHGFNRIEKAALPATFPVMDVDTRFYALRLALPAVAGAEGMHFGVRELDTGDLDLVCRHREDMFRDAGSDERVLAAMAPHFRAWLEPRLADRSYFGFVLSDGDTPVAGIGLLLIDWPPHPLHPTQDKRGYVLNVFVEPDYRRRGLASKLMQLAEAEFRRRGVALAVLHATEKGLPVYRARGWQATTEMAKGTLP